MIEYLRYYTTTERILRLAKGTPECRDAEENPIAGRTVISFPRLGGLHHRYNLAA